MKSSDFILHPSSFIPVVLPSYPNSVEGRGLDPRQCRFESCRGHIRLRIVDFGLRIIQDRNPIRNPQSAIREVVTTVKTTLYGKTGRAQLAILDMTGADVPARKQRDRPEFCVTLLPRSANRSTSFASAGDRVYLGPSYETAMLHIRAWTGL